MVETFTYVPKGTCSRKMNFEIDSDSHKIIDFEVIGGCNGNLAGIKRLIIGMKCEEVVSKLSGTTCGYKNTSCPDQLACGLNEYLKEKEGKNND